MSSSTRQQLEAWLKTISIKDDTKIIDIGGSQNPIKSRLKDYGKRTTFEILDLSHPHELKGLQDIIADINSPSLQKNELSRFGTEWAKHHEYYDTAFCIEVSEYLWNPVQALQNIYYLLKKGGGLFMSFHFIYPVHNPASDDYLRFTESGVRKILSETGFEIVDMQYRTADNDNVLSTFYQMEGMRPAKESDASVVGFLVSAVKL